MQVHIAERLHDQRVAVIGKLRVLKTLRKPVEHALDHAVAVQHDIAVPDRVEFAELRHRQDVAVQRGPAFRLAHVDVGQLLKRRRNGRQKLRMLCDHAAAADVARKRQQFRNQRFRKQHRVAAFVVCDRCDDARRILFEPLQKPQNRLRLHAGLIPYRVQNSVRIGL